MFSRSYLLLLAGLGAVTQVLGAPIMRPPILDAHALAARQAPEAGIVARAMVGGLGSIDSPVIEARAPVVAAVPATQSSDVSEDDLDELVDALEEMMQVPTSSVRSVHSKRDVQVGDAIASVMERLTRRDATEMSHEDRELLERQIAPALISYRL